MFFGGIDPDLHTVPIVFLDYDEPRSTELSGPVIITQINIPKQLKGVEALVSLAKVLSKQESPEADVPFADFGAIAVEGQSMEQAKKSGVRPKDILRLGISAGSLLTVVGALCDDIYFPEPQQWKGTVPKDIHQARTCARMGWDYEKRAGYVKPIVEQGMDYVFLSIDEDGVMDDSKSPRVSDWKHVMDSIGLALYAKDVLSGVKRYRPRT